MSGNTQEKNTTSLKHRYMMVAITTTPFGFRLSYWTGCYEYRKQVHMRAD